MKGRQSKLAGMIGGLGPLSTIYYYRLLVSECRRVCGHAPRLLIYTIPVEEMCRSIREDRIDMVASLLLEALRSLARGGAEVVFISANTPHIAWRAFREEADRLGVEPVSIVDAAVEHVAKRGYRRVAVLGAKRLYESGIYQQALREKGVEVVELPEDIIEEVDELITVVAHGEDEQVHRARAADIVKRVEALGAEAAILACTELPYLLEGVNTGIELVDTARVQVEEVIRRVVGLGEDGSHAARP